MNDETPNAAGHLMSRMRARTGPQMRGELPFVSVVTPTWNRRAFLPYLIYMFQYQDYPVDKRELVILDDSEQSNADLVAMLNKDGRYTIRYYHQTERLTIGAKRNALNALAKGEYIICMDDDDYYPADKISYTIGEMRQHNALFAGCDQIAIWYSHIDRVYRTPALGQYHALNGTFAYHRNFLRKHRYDDKATLAEEEGFTNGFTVPVLQLDPDRSILCISHNANTYDKDFVLGSAEYLTEGIAQRVSDPQLRSLYQRLRDAPANSKIDWHFFDKVVINRLSDDENQHQKFLQALQQQGVPEALCITVQAPKGAPLAESHLQAMDLAQQQGWKNYLLLDDRVTFVRQEKTVNNINTLLQACGHVPWDVLLLGSELLRAYPLKSLPGCIKPLLMSRPVAYVVNHTHYAAFRDMLEKTLKRQRGANSESTSQGILHWDRLCREANWLALYPSWAYRASDDQGNDSAWRYFKKLTVSSPSTSAADMEAAIKQQ